MRLAAALSTAEHPCTPGEWSLRRAELTERWSRERRLERLVVDVVEPADEELGECPRRFLPWDIGEQRVLPMRDLGPGDAGRLDALTKSAADGTLAPALVWWHSGLCSHVVLDGHVRLAAFARAGVAVRALVLTRDDPEPPPANWRRRLADREAAIEANVTDPVVRNRLLSELHLPTQERRRDTVARVLPGGIAAWRADAAAHDPAWAADAEAWLGP